jgi:hypothetical protein
MTADQQPSDATIRALGTIDLSGGAETPAATVGRVLLGSLLLIIGGVLALGFFAAYFIGTFVPAIADWVDILGDFLLVPAFIGVAIAITGFELVRRSRKARAAEARESADLITKLGAAGALDGTATPESIQAAMGGMDAGVVSIDVQDTKPGTTTSGRETHL